MKLSKNRYLLGFGIIVVLLALVRCAFPSVAEPIKKESHGVDSSSVDNVNVTEIKGSGKKSESLDTMNIIALTNGSSSRFFNSDGSVVKNRIRSVPCFAKAFPDQNDVQLISANKYGVRPVANMTEAEKRKADLVYVGGNPYFYVDRLHNSIPYLVPRAAVLLQNIGHSFFDSLQIKGIPLHKIIITSVMRSKADVEKLRGHNGNATQNSCHLYGTTFDICYNRYKTVEDPEGSPRRKVRNDTLKWVLSEVLNDMRLHDECFVKYEVNQGCFHITVK